jgi:hypothetical protein
MNCRITFIARHELLHTPEVVSMQSENDVILSGDDVVRYVDLLWI